MSSSTYSSNRDIVLYTGQQLKFADDINSASISNLLDTTRVQAYNYINSKLRGRTAVPATDSAVTAQLKDIERNFVIGWLLGAGLSGERNSNSDWPAFYLELAEKALDNLSFPATASSPTAESYNTGNGVLTITALNDEFTRTERWELMYSGNNYFSVNGSKSGRLPSMKVGENYPDEKVLSSYDEYDSTLSSTLRYHEYPFYATISAGSTDWALYDRIIFYTFASSFRDKITDSLPIVRRG
jgi:hypothetical protein